jgi:hypothetical protein
MKVADILMEIEVVTIANGDSVELKERLVMALKEAQHESLVLLIRKMWPGFMKHHEYTLWRAQTHEVVKSNGELQKQLAVLVEQSYKSTPESQMQAIVASGKLSMNKVFTSGSWLASFIGTMQYLPVSLTLSSAKREEHGFPLIHVNRCFELETGYTQEEVMGRNCRFLQSHHQNSFSVKNATMTTAASEVPPASESGIGTGTPETEMETNRCIASSSAAISTALQAGRPVQVFIPNFRKDGTMFLNLVSLKPVFEAKTREYLYVIGLQFDASNVESRSYLQDLAKGLMSLLPDTVESGGDDVSAIGSDCLNATSAAGGKGCIEHDVAFGVGVDVTMLKYRC